MKLIIPGLTGLGIGLAAGFVLICAIRRLTDRFRRDAAAFAEFPAGSAAFAEFPAGSAGYTGALAQVTAYAGEHEAFRQAWETAVRRAADAMTAHIAGLWMAGQAHGTVAWDAAYPVLPAMDGDALEAAFQLAVHGEVSRRIKTMHGPGAFG